MPKPVGPLVPRTVGFSTELLAQLLRSLPRCGDCGKPATFVAYEGAVAVETRLRGYPAQCATDRIPRCIFVCDGEDCRREISWPLKWLTLLTEVRDLIAADRDSHRVFWPVVSSGGVPFYGEPEAWLLAPLVNQEAVRAACVALRIQE